MSGNTFAYLDEGSKREIRRSIFKAVAIPGYQVPFGSRELPIGRGWGTGGIQLTLSIIGRSDVLKVIDQGSDESVNAVNIKEFVKSFTDVQTTSDSEMATIIQSRHRVPETPLRNDQIMVLQVPGPEPLRGIEASEEATKVMHAEADYVGIWLELYEDLIRHGSITAPCNYPVEVQGRYIMSPSPIPKYDNHKLSGSDCLYLFGAGREKKIYALPPYCTAVSLAFEDIPFQTEDFRGKSCCLCGAESVYLDEIYDAATGDLRYQCSDTGFCKKRRETCGAAERRLEA